MLPDPIPPSTPNKFRETLAAARRGDAAALERLFEGFYPRVQRMVHARLARDLRTTRPWLAARFSTGDIVQEVFRSVLEDLNGFEGTNDGAFAGYLAMVVRNRIVDAVRFHEAGARDGRRSRGVRDDADGERDQGDPAQDLVSAEDLERFQAALTTFPERVQLLLRARLERTESFPTLAQRLGYGSASAARRAFSAAQARLALLLDGER
jgi:RNA polymerase sigma factor (sigma-70 family)